MVAVTAVVLLASACELLGALDPTRCVESERPANVALDGFRIVQTNQFPDNSIRLLERRGAGIEVRLVTDLENAVFGTAIVEVDALDDDDQATRLMTETFDCLRPSWTALGTVDGDVIDDGPSYRVRITDEGGRVIVERTVAPDVLRGPHYQLVLVPLRVNGIDAKRDAARMNGVALRAHAMFPTEVEPVVLPVLDIGEIAEPGFRSIGIVQSAFVQYVSSLRAQGLLPPLAVAIGLVPHSGVGWGGMATFMSGVADESDMETILHELGHALGVPHAFGCGAPNPSPDSAQSLLDRGYDYVTRQWLGGNDIMSYCRPQSWLGAWGHALVVERLAQQYEWNDLGVERLAASEPEAAPFLMVLEHHDPGSVMALGASVARSR